MESSRANIISKLIESYGSVSGLNNTDGLSLPSKPAVGGICEDLLKVLFPGFHDEEVIHADFLQELTAQRVDSLGERLEDQVCRSLRVDDPKCPKERARDLLVSFFDGLPAIRELLQTDVVAAFEGDPAAECHEEIVLAYPFLETMAIQRSAHLLYRLGVPLIPRIMTEWAHSRTGIDIHPGAEIGTHFFIDHGTGVVIGETSVIGNRVKMYQGVALIGKSLAGGQTLKGQRRHPKIEDGVTIYAGTTIMGAETVIGAGSTIGANVFLTHSVDPRSLVFYEEKQLRILAKRDPADAALEWHI